MLGLLIKKITPANEGQGYKTKKILVLRFGYFKNNNSLNLGRGHTLSSTICSNLSVW